MIDWIVTSSLLIVIIIVLRAILKGRIGLRLQYGLWLLVLLRLLIPLNLPSQLSVLNLLPEENGQAFTQPLTYVAYDPQSLPDLARPEVDPALPEEQQQIQYQQALQEYEQTINEAKAQTGIAVSWSTVLYAVWIVGMVAMAAILLISNFRFNKQLRKTEIDTVTIGCHLPTYISDVVATPCLFGLFRPRIYLTFESVKSKDLKQYVVTHELAHYHHKDHIWSALRVLCLVLHWYNPLVWAAAILSKQDAELCCDETAIKFLGEAQRQNYGKALIEMSCVKKDMKSLFITATTMIGSKKALKERIILIAKHPRTALLTLIVVILVACIAVGCTFTGQQAESTEPSTEPSVESTEPSSEPTEPAPTGYPEDEVQFTLAYVNGHAYIHDSTWMPGTRMPSSYELSGTIISENNKHAPITERAACHIRPGTLIYTNPNDDMYIFYWDQSEKENHPRRMIRLDQTDIEIEMPLPSLSPDETQIDSPMLFHDGKLWIIESYAGSNGVVPYRYKNDGIVTSRDDNKHPSEEGAAVLLDPGTKIYTTDNNGIDLYTCDSNKNVLKFVLHTSSLPTPETDPLGYYQLLLTDHYYMMALTSLYDSPEQVDLEQLFYAGVPHRDSSAITNAEKTYLASKGFETMMDIQRTATDSIDVILKVYFGIDFQHSQKIGLDRMIYWDETDCYYTNHNDFNGVSVTVTDVQVTDNGYTHVYYRYSYGFPVRFGRDGDQLLLTLRPGESGTPYVVSNQLASYTPLA